MTGPKKQGGQSTGVLRRSRAALLRRLPSWKVVLRGSLIERYKRCGRPRCSCSEGQGHGPKYYLSVSRSGQRPIMVYIPAAFLKEVKGGLERYRRARGILEGILEINVELLRRREGLA